MKILKYFVLLILLSCVGVFVFLSTQSNEFDVEKKIFVKFDKDIVQHYLSDLKNWNEWNNWNENQTINPVTFSDTTTIVKSTMTWKQGKLTTQFNNFQDSISHKVNLNQFSFDSGIKLKDTVGGTLVTWKTKGSVGFKDKILLKLKGGNNEYFKNILVENLNNLNARLSKEFNTYAIKVGKVTRIESSFYVYQNIQIQNKNYQNSVNQSIETLYKFLKNSNTLANGKPFMQILSVSQNSKNVKIGIPIKSEIFVAEPSDVMIGNYESFSALKITLNGDLSHRKEAISKANQLIIKNNLIVSTNQPIIDVYIENSYSGKSPSKWITEILIPIYHTFVPPPTIATNSIGKSKINP